MEGRFITKKLRKRNCCVILTICNFSGAITSLEYKKEPIIPEMTLDSREKKKKQRRKSNGLVPTSQMGGTLGTLMSVFRSQYLPPIDGTNPNSYESLKKCRYIRSYGIMSDEEKAEARQKRTSSWSTDALQA